MSHFKYPQSWYALEQVPSARWELINIAESVGRWNEDGSPVRETGSDSIVDFLFNVYNLDEGVERVVGGLIFSDELADLSRFTNLFRWFVDEWHDSHGDINTLREAVLLSEITDAARTLYVKLKERGLPEVVDDGQEGNRGQ